MHGVRVHLDEGGSGDGAAALRAHVEERAQGRHLADEGHGQGDGRVDVGPADPGEGQGHHQGRQSGPQGAVHPQVWSLSSLKVSWQILRKT